MTSDDMCEYDSHMERPITSLPSLLCFRAAAQHESFSKAAHALNLTHGAVSRAVRLLEEDLGTPLFERRNRAVFLTDEGRKLAAVTIDGLGRIEAAARLIRSSRKDRVLTLSCEPTLMMRWLIPRLPTLSIAGLDLQVQLVAAGGAVQLGTGIDAAIRRNDFAWPSDYVADHLFGEQIGPVCRPADIPWLFPDGELAASAPLLHTRTRPDAWMDWARCAKRPASLDHGQWFEHFYFSLQAAIAGVGVAIAPWKLAQDDIANGLLAAPFGFVPDGSAYYLLSRDRIAPGSSLANLRAWLRGQAED
jgi:LysR family glycine cleavage system transcriptional activator